MENKKIMAFVLTGALASGTIGAGSTVYAVDDSTDYVLTIPATLAVENAGWNATEGITAKVKDGDTFDSTKKLKVTASSGDSWALEAEGVTGSIGYNLAAATGTYSSTAEAASWEFSADELNAESGAGTKKAMGIIVEDYSTKPAGNYQDTVTFTATVESAVIPVSSVTLNKSTLELTAGGDPATLTASVLPENATDKTVTWKSSDTSVATVVNGVVTPIAEGTADITAVANDGSNAYVTCSITVSSAFVAGESTWNYSEFSPIRDNVPFTKNGVTFVSDWKSGGNLYAGHTHKFTATGHKIKKIEFATTSTNANNGNFSSGTVNVENFNFDSTQDRRNVDGKKVTWTGDAETVTFTGHAYAIEYIKITVE